MADKLNPLDEVRAAAKYNYIKNLRDKEEREAFDAAKVNGGVDELVEVRLAELKAKKTNIEKKGK